MKRGVMTSSSNKRNVKQSSNGDHYIKNENATSMMKKMNNNSKVLREAKKKKKKRLLLKYEELPDYLKDNEFILDYYRSEWPLKDTFLSVFSLHNETLNIWTHLGGFLIFLCLTVMSFMETTTTTTSTLQVPTLLFSFSRSIFSPLMMMMNTSNVTSDLAGEHGLLGSILHFNVAAFNSESQIPRWPWFVFLFGAMSCLICSSISHLLACHSRRLNLFFWRLDYAGISVMIVCSFFAPIYYAFLCNPMSRLFYLTTITLVGILVVITLLAPTLSSANYRSFRATLFLTMGFSGVIPATHAVILHWGHHPIYVALGYELAMAVCYAVGVVFYVCRIPERWKPGAFDLAGHSHQIFHVFVVAGALAHCLATLELIEWRLTSPSC